MERVRLLAVVCFLLAAVVAGCGGDDNAAGGRVTLNWWAYNEPSGSFDDAVAYCNKQSGGEYTIVYNKLAANADAQRQSLVRRLAAKDSSIDLMSMDVIWTAEFAEAEWIKPFPEPYRKQISKGTLEGPLATATYKNKLYGAPANSNTQLLWYDKRKVDSPPKTWDELIQQATELNTDIEVQASAYEGYMVWFNTLLESAGGHVLATPEKASLEEGPTRTALDIIHTLAASPAADPSIANSKEDSGRLAFEKGTALFQINYPFIYPSAKENNPELYKNIGWALYPQVDAETPAKPPVGGFNWGVGNYTDHPKQAFDAATCLRNEHNQRIFATKGGLPPTLASIYDDPAFKKAYPFADEIRQSLENGSVRPATPVYADVSLAIVTALSPPDGFDVDAAVSDLKQTVQDALESKGLN
jgi:multiple sugar transport system substrate-binding protein